MTEQIPMIKKEKTTPTQASMPVVLLITVAVILLVGIAVYSSTQQLSSPIAGAGSGSAATEFESGNGYYSKGQYEESAAAYQRAIQKDPNYQDAYANLGVVYYRLGKFDLAETQYKKALALKSSDADTSYNLGALYLQQALIKGNPPDKAAFEQAIKQLEQALATSAQLKEPYFSLGVAYRAIGEKNKAIEAFKKFLASSPQDAQAMQEAKRYLAELQK